MAPPWRPSRGAIFAFGSVRANPPGEPRVWPDGDPILMLGLVVRLGGTPRPTFRFRGRANPPGEPRVWSADDRFGI